MRLQRENDDLAEELVSSKVALRADMDKVCYHGNFNVSMTSNTCTTNTSNNGNKHFVVNLCMLTCGVSFFYYLLNFTLSQLEERIDTLCKESRAHKSSAEASNLLISELREELQQVCTLKS